MSAFRQIAGVSYRNLKADTVLKALQAARADTVQMKAAFAELEVKARRELDSKSPQYDASLIDVKMEMFTASNLAFSILDDLIKFDLLHAEVRHNINDAVEMFERTEGIIDANDYLGVTQVTGHKISIRVLNKGIIRLTDDATKRWREFNRTDVRAVIPSEHTYYEMAQNLINALTGQDLLAAQPSERAANGKLLHSLDPFSSLKVALDDYAMPIVTSKRPNSQEPDYAELFADNPLFGMI